MSIPVSTVPAASAYLLNAIQTQVNADPLAASMLVKLGQPSQDVPPDAIIIGEVIRTLATEAMVGSGGPLFLREAYDLHITAQSFVGSGDADVTSVVATQVNNRAWQLAAYVETAVRLDPSLGELVDVAYPLDASTSGPDWVSNPGGLLVAIVVIIHVEATI